MGFSDLQVRIKKLQDKIDVDDASIADSSMGRSSVIQTDCNFALKRFLLDTETLVAQEPEGRVNSALEVESEEEDAQDTPTSSPATLAERRELVPGDDMTENAHKGDSSDFQAPKDAFSTREAASENSSRWCCIMEYCALRMAGLSEGKEQPKGRQSHSLHLYGFGSGVLFFTYKVQTGSTHFVTAKQTFTAHFSDELSFDSGDVILKRAVVSEDRWEGQIGRERGYFHPKLVEECEIGPSVFRELKNILTGHSLLDESETERLYQAICKCIADISQC